MHRVVYEHPGYQAVQQKLLEAERAERRAQFRLIQFREAAGRKFRQAQAATAAWVTGDLGDDAPIPEPEPVDTVAENAAVAAVQAMQGPVLMAREELKQWLGRNAGDLLVALNRRREELTPQWQELVAALDKLTAEERELRASEDEIADAAGVAHLPGLRAPTTPDLVNAFTRFPGSSERSDLDPRDREMLDRFSYTRDQVSTETHPSQAGRWVADGDGGYELIPDGAA